ncbi:MAG: large conductance mechanosensitive channel protein MscL [Candidatus Binatia bacterium]
MLKEFRDFAMRGNVLDMAVGIIIGTAFGKIVNSLVTDIIMPPIGVILGEVDFSQLYLSLGSAAFPTLAEAQKAGAPTLNYGLFLNNILNFVIVAFAMFMLIRQMHRFLPKPPPPPASTKDCPRCAMPIPIRATKCGHCTADLGAA